MALTSAFEPGFTFGSGGCWMGSVSGFCAGACSCCGCWFCSCTLGVGAVGELGGGVCAGCWPGCCWPDPCCPDCCCPDCCCPDCCEVCCCGPANIAGLISDAITIIAPSCPANVFLMGP